MTVFFDTNILVYCLENGDPTDVAQITKQQRAKELVHTHTIDRSAIISTQVLGELFNTLTRKGHPPYPRSLAVAVIDHLTNWGVIPADASFVQAAARRSHLSQLSYDDSLIVEAAIRAGAATLYTEDMHHGMRFGMLEICNPFLA